MKGLNIFSFIDDLDTFENDELESNYSDIYCGELKLKKENENPCKGLFLDLSLECHNKTFSVGFLMIEMVFPFISVTRPI